MASFQDSTSAVVRDSAVTTIRTASDTVQFRRPARKVVPLSGTPASKQDSAALFADTTRFIATSDSNAADSVVVFPQSNPARKIEVINLYQKHELPLLHRGPITKPDLSPDWFFPILILIAGAFTWLRLFYSKYFSQMLVALINVNLSNQIVRDENILVQRATVYLSLTFNLIAALFLYQLSFRLGWDLTFIGGGFPRFIFFTIVVSAVYTFKFIALKFCGWLFDLEREMSTYLFNIFIINNFLGIVLLPFIIIMVYNPQAGGAWMLTASLVLIAAVYLFRIFRGILIGLGTPGVSLLYLFLYLCTLEIAPLLMLLRLTGAG